MTVTRTLELDQAAVLIDSSTAEELFGVRGHTTGSTTGSGEPSDEARGNYRRLVRSCHPDHNPNDVILAREVFARLQNMWDDYCNVAAPRKTNISTKKRAYAVGDLYAAGDIANLYVGRYATGPGSGDADDGTQTVLIKMPRQPTASDLMRSENTALTTLGRDVAPDYQAYFPNRIESFRHRDATSRAERLCVVEELLDGFFTLQQVREAFPQGVPAKHVAWMWRRLLVAIGAAHQVGLVHGAVFPEHVLIHPEEHGLVLVDWCYATEIGEPISAIVSKHRAAYPDEVLAKAGATAATDIYLATSCMLGLLGPTAPEPLRRFAKGCMFSKQAMRPHDAWVLKMELDDLIERMWGPRRFLPFAMPNSPKPSA